MPEKPNSISYVTDFERESEIWFLPVCKDRNGAVIQNSAKGTFPKPRVEPVSIGVIKATVRKENYTDGDFKTQLNATNSGSWRDWAAGQAYIAHIRTWESNEFDTPVTMVRYVVLCCELGWKALTPQLGYYYLDDGKIKVFTDEAGMPYIGNLSNGGGSLAASSDMIIKEWDIKRQIGFGVLGF
jgi:hypothetical protein